MATLVRLEPFREVAAMQNELSRFMNGLLEGKDGALTVSAERERSEEISSERFHRFERRFGSFSRTVGLPQGVSEDDIKASYEDGVLQIHVPKPAQPKPKRIQVGGSEDGQGTIEGTSTQA